MRKLDFKLFVFYMCLYACLRELVRTLVKWCAFFFSIMTVELADGADIL